jgi:uncharacterized membrane protein YfcA
VEWYELAGLVTAGAAGSFVNTLAGGGSMILVPSLMLFGLPADLANGTSRVPILAQCATGAYGFARGGRLETAAAFDAAPLTLVGALVGAYVATILPNAVFEPLLVGTMIVMALGLLLRPDTLAPPEGTTPRRAMGSPLSMLALLLAGFYGGVLQAGAGLVFLALLAGLLRYDLVRANALKAVVMLAYIAVTVGVFAAYGKIAWEPALAMTAGAIAGAWLGVRLAIKRGVQLIRVVVIVAVIAVSIYVVVR